MRKENERSSVIEYLEEAKLIAELDATADDILRISIEQATGANTIVIRGKIKGQNNWDTLKTIVGNVNTTLIIDTYDLLQVECTSFGSTSNVVILAIRGFDG